MNDVLIIGKGYLGNYLHKMFGWDIMTKDDLFKPSKLYKKDYDNIIYTSWVTDVDSWEENKEYNYMHSLFPLSKLVTHCHLTKAKLLFVSSAFVFGGFTGYYEENEIPDYLSINNYGQSKLLGEKLCEYCKNIIIRIDDVFGKNKLYQHDKAAKDRFSTPVYVKDLCNAIKFLLEKDANGIFHVAGNTRLDRFSFSVLTNPKCKYCKLEKLNLKAIRPKDSSMKNEKITRMGFEFTTLEEALKEAMK